MAAILEAMLERAGPAAIGVAVRSTDAPRTHSINVRLLRCGYYAEVTLPDGRRLEARGHSYVVPANTALLVEAGVADSPPVVKESGQRFASVTKPSRCWASG